MSLPPAAESPVRTCDLRSCARPAVRVVDACIVCEQHVDLAFVARVPPPSSLRRYFSWAWKLTPELLNEFYDRSGPAWEDEFSPSELP
jgi:hypothetical protein